MTAPAKAPSTTDCPQLQGLQSGLALVSSPVDHHAHDEVNLMRTLVDAVATGDRDAVFTIARCLVSGSTVRAMGVVTRPPGALRIWTR